MGQNQLAPYRCWLAFGKSLTCVVSQFSIADVASAASVKLPPQGAERLQHASVDLRRCRR